VARRGRLAAGLTLGRLRDGWGRWAGARSGAFRNVPRPRSAVHRNGTPSSGMRPAGLPPRRVLRLDGLLAPASPEAARGRERRGSSAPGVVAVRYFVAASGHATAGRPPPSLAEPNHRSTDVRIAVSRDDGGMAGRWRSQDGSRSVEVVRRTHGHQPARVVLHKSSQFSDAEVSGFQGATDDRDIDSAELLWIQRRGAPHLFRTGQLPPLRGTSPQLARRDPLLPDLPRPACPPAPPHPPGHRHDRPPGRSHRRPGHVHNELGQRAARRTRPTHPPHRH
jgi:hypothetical protein